MFPGALRALSGGRDEGGREYAGVGVAVLGLSPSPSAWPAWPAWIKKLVPFGGRAASGEPPLGELPPGELPPNSSSSSSSTCGEYSPSRGVASTQGVSSTRK